MGTSIKIFSSKQTKQKLTIKILNKFWEDTQILRSTCFKKIVEFLKFWVWSNLILQN
jgi:hypothetical protein